MKISEVLVSTHRVYIEAAPLIYYVEANPTYLARMDALISAIESNVFSACNAVLTLTEVLVHPLREGNHTLS